MFSFKRSLSFFDMGNSSHNLMPVSHSKCLSLINDCVCGACVESHKCNTKSRNCQTFINNSLWLSFIELFL